MQARRRIERAEGLVHQDDARLQDERARNSDALPHPARELARVLRTVALDVEADLRDPRARLFIPLARRHTSALEPERDVVLDRPVVERRVVLEDHAAVGARATDCGAAHEHAAFRARMLRRQPRNQPQHGGLTAAGRPENRDELAFVRPVLNRERHVVDGGEAAIPLRDAAELDDVRDGRGGLGHHSSATRYGNRPRWNQNSTRSMP